MSDLFEHMSTEPVDPPVYDVKVGTTVGYELPGVIERFARARSRG
jgi:hypothetical protein